ncbi:MAG: hypothetical protein JWR61_3645 [Ferruginibacter sp.]|nr:hypothetical protein [Ferruginibacter sp.]
MAITLYDKASQPFPNNYLLKYFFKVHRFANLPMLGVSIHPLILRCQSFKNNQHTFTPHL